MKIHIDSIRVKEGVVFFNVYLHTEDDNFQMILAGWRVMKGKIYSPAIKNSNSYTSIVHVNKDFAVSLYNELAKIRTLNLLEPQKALAALVTTQETLDIFLPTLFPRGL